MPDWYGAVETAQLAGVPCCESRKECGTGLCRCDCHAESVGCWLISDCGRNEVYWLHEDRVLAGASTILSCRDTDELEVVVFIGEAPCCSTASKDSFRIESYSMCLEKSFTEHMDRWLVVPWNLMCETEALCR